MKSFWPITLSVLLLLNCCKEEQETNPRIETLEITPISSVSFIANGNIIEIGNSSIIDYGFEYQFVFATGGSTPLNSAGVFGPLQTTISLGNQVLVGAFQKEILVDFERYNQNFLIVVRAYITNERGTIYGEIKQVGLPFISISSIAPLTAKVGDRIAINGKNFSSKPMGNKVSFNTKTAEVIESTTTKLVVEVPDGINYEYYNPNIQISVKSGGSQAISSEIFRLAASVTTFTPTSGVIGTTVTLNGANFYQPGTIYVDGVGTNSSLISSSSLTFTIPSGITKDKVAISLTVNGTSLVVPGEFTILAPEIISFAPEHGVGGSLIKITGKNFYDIYNSKIKLGGSLCSIQSYTSTEVYFVVPKELALGNYALSYSTNLHSVTSTTNFTLGSPEITEFLPTTGIAGTYITVNGNKFGSWSYENTILMGTIQMTIYSWNEDSIRALIPNSLPGGNYKITVNTGGQSVTSLNDFIIQ